MSSDLPHLDSVSWAAERPASPSAPRTQLIVAVLALGTIASFTLDSMTPRGVGDGIGYPILLTLCLWLRARWIVFAYAAIATLLTVGAGFLASPGVSVEATILNRAYIIAVIWVMAALLSHRVRIVERLRASEREAHAASEAKSNFLANMSHELRTPLNVIIGFAELIGRQSAGPIGPAKYVEYANTIQKSGAHLLAMVDDVLHLSRMQADKYRLDEGEISLSTTVAEAARLVAGAAAEAGLTVEERATADLPRVRADRRAIRQLLLNLLSNAIKFTPRGGRITVEAGASDDGPWLAVSDTGVGIAKHDLAKLGEPFPRVGPGARGGEAAAGLGLALARRLAELHGGRLEIESEVGRGTVARVVLPKTRIVVG